MVSEIYESILRRLVQANGLETHGFRRALKEMLEEEEGVTDPEEIEEEMEHYYGNFKLHPVAFRIEKSQNDWHHVHVYEIVLGRHVPDWKLRAYGRMADGDGPMFTLHIIGSLGHEAIIPCEVLMCLWLTKNPMEVIAEYLAGSGEIAGAPLIPVTASAARISVAGTKLSLQQQKNAAFKALKELGLIPETRRTR